ncbi:cation:proton antiporter [candidate division TA06 bacterium]|uniref:Cation:proton antiporter n=1 Tax=candidate division TA06 bacterium TaxID=2250710 RepID=A0A660SEI3_UNCT6|nr:MAG: cation:proton antiporter [candidate division TA06 bacterium]
MRKIIGIILLIIICWGIILSLYKIPFGIPKTKVGEYYIDKGREETGAANIVTSVVLNYRGFDTLGEVTVLFLAAIGLVAVLATLKKKEKRKIEPSSLILRTGCRFLFPLILLFGAYIFIHGHLTPGGGFQGGAIIASAFILVYLGCRGRRISKTWSSITESLGGLIFVIIGLVGLAVGGHYFLSNFLPKGELNTLFSAGIIPIIYIAIGFKVGSELAGVIDNLMEES